MAFANQPEWEREYREKATADLVRPFRIAALIGAAGWSVSALFDVPMRHVDGIGEVIILKLGVIALFHIALFAGSGSDRLLRFAQASVIAGVAANLLGVTVAMSLYPDNVGIHTMEAWGFGTRIQIDEGRFIAVAILCIALPVAIQSLGGVRFHYALVINALSASVLFVAYHLFNPDLFTVVSLGLILIPMYPLTLYGAWQLERYKRIEFVAAKRIDAEQQKSESLLLNILPASIAARLKNGEHIADRFDSVTVLFADIAGFTQLAATLPAARIVELLNQVFSRFDRLADWLKLEKIKTIGDAYMVAGGIPKPTDDHAVSVARMALGMLRILDDDGDHKGLQMRIGIASGPVVAGVIGERKFSYDLWGDTVNLASRMESHGENGRIQVCATTQSLLAGQFELSPRGVVEIKGKGEIETWWLDAERPDQGSGTPGQPQP